MGVGGGRWRWPRARGWPRPRPTTVFSFRMAQDRGSRTREEFSYAGLEMGRRIRDRVHCARGVSWRGVAWRGAVVSNGRVELDPVSLGLTHSPYWTHYRSVSLEPGADPEGPSGGGDATQVAYLQEENGPFAYLSGGAPELQGEGTHPSPPPRGSAPAPSSFSWQNVKCL